MGRDFGEIAARPWWRKGDSYSLSLNDARGVWYDFVTGRGGGILDLILEARGGTRQEALHWLADLTGTPVELTPLSAAGRTHWAAEQRALERDLPSARYWRRSAVALGEETLMDLKAALFDSALPMPEVDQIYRWTQQVTRWRRMDRAALVTEYDEWRKRQPEVTAGMVKAARDLETAEMRATLRYLTEASAEAAA